MTASDEEVVKLSKFKNTLLALGSCAFVALGIWMAFLSDAEIESQRRYNNSLIVHSVGWAAAIFAGMCGLIGVRKLLDHKPGLILSSAGLTDNSSGLSAGFIPWHEIAGFAVYAVRKQKLLVVLLIDPEKYLNTGNVLRRNLNRINHRMAGSPIFITSNSLRLRFDDLLHVCNEYFYKYGSTAQQGAPADASGTRAFRASEIGR